VPTHICGAGLAFLGFAVSLIIGLYVDNPFNTVVLRALVVLAVFYLLGVTLAALAQRAVQENFDNEVKATQKNDPENDPENAQTASAQVPSVPPQADQTSKEPAPA